MAADADLAQGVVLSRNGNAIIGITSLSGPTVTAETADITDLSSTWREHKVTLFNGGEISITGNYLYDNTEHVGIRTDMLAKTLQAWTIGYTDGGTTTASFSAFVTAFSTEEAVAGTIVANITLLVSGAVSWA